MGRQQPTSQSHSCKQENCPPCQKPLCPAENEVPLPQPSSGSRARHPLLAQPSLGEITAPFLQRLNPRTRNLTIRACQFGTQHCNRSSYQQLDTPPRLICARNTVTVLNRELDYLFKLFTKGWGDFSVI